MLKSIPVATDGSALSKKAGVRIGTATINSDLADSVIAAARKHNSGRKGLQRLLLGNETQHVLTLDAAGASAPLGFPAGRDIKVKTRCTPSLPPNGAFPGGTRSHLGACHGSPGPRKAPERHRRPAYAHHDPSTRAAT